MSFQEKYLITPQYLTKPSKRRSGIQITAGVKFVVAHDSGNPGSTALNNVNYFEHSCNDESASAHIFVDDKSIIECIPALTAAPEKAWHVLYRGGTDNHMFGCNANDAAIGVEYCYGDHIDADEAYRKYIWVIAFICYRFQLDPAKSVVGHFFLDPKRKTDPVTGLAHSRRSYDQLLRDIVLEYQASAPATSGIAAHPAPQWIFVARPGTVEVTAKLNIRKGLPRKTAEIADVATVGAKLAYIGWIDKGEEVNGNSRWYLNADGNYFWSGATQQL